MMYFYIDKFKNSHKYNIFKPCFIMSVQIKYNLSVINIKIHFFRALNRYLYF